MKFLFKHWSFEIICKKIIPWHKYKNWFTFQIRHYPVSFKRNISSLQRGKWAAYSCGQCQNTLPPCLNVLRRWTEVPNQLYDCMAARNHDNKELQWHTQNLITHLFPHISLPGKNSSVIHVMTWATGKCFRFSAELICRNCFKFWKNKKFWKKVLSFDKEFEKNKT